jgi:hypothetical protein
MPIISVFFGIAIFMNFDDHLPPHFHARYQDFEAMFTLDGELLKGEMSSKQRKLIAAWAALHEEDLRVNWEMCQAKLTPFRLEGLRG